MAFSRQFRALAKVSAFFTGVWGAIGIAVGAFRGQAIGDGTLLSSILTYGLGYGAVGGISGVVTGLLLARAESGRRIEEVATWRIAGWGVIGGLAPAALFGLLALVFGATASQLLPLLGLGIVGGGVGGVISASASATAKRAALAEPEAPPELPAS